MNRLVSHIEFLLHKHNCVIIPNLGGFVVNSIHARSEGLATFHPPACELVFNRELTYNDGLLAESYMRIYDLSFDKAMWSIEQAVNELNREIRENGEVKLGSLGGFKLIENNRFRYTPGEFVRPSFFGLDSFSIKSMIQMQPVKEIPISASNKRSIRSVGVAAAAVAAILLMVFILPMSDTNIDRQSARIMYETEWAKPKPKQYADVYMGSTKPASETEAVAASADVTNDSGVDSPKYYVIMGVFAGNQSSAKMIDMLRSKGFSDADCIERHGRFDVYAASFDNETAADIYLREVHKKYPAHSDAWILKR